MKQISFSGAAAERLGPKLDEAGGRLKLVYDTEGCGCAVNGVPALWIVDEGKPGDRTTEGDPFEVLFEPNHAVFFEDRMTVDYEPKHRSFILKSRQQIYTNRLQLTDKRNRRP